MKHRSGTLFDPGVVDAFVKGVEKNAERFRIESEARMTPPEFEKSTLKA